MMRFEKLGLVVEPMTKLWWSKNYAILPTPVYIQNPGILRVFYATTDEQNFGRVTFVDLDPADPRKILHHHETPVMDPGAIGAFDDCGVNPSSIFLSDDKYYLAYVGYQRHFRAPYSLLAGLANLNFDDNLVSISRYQETPILERRPGELNIRTAPVIMRVQNHWMCWYVSDLGWKKLGNDTLFPNYNISCILSDSFTEWKNQPQVCLSPERDECGFGRPWVSFRNGSFEMTFSVRTMGSHGKLEYRRFGYAVSKDGIRWERKDDLLQSWVPSESGWDSEMICYGSRVQIGKDEYMFYNGNANGRTGFGVAKRIG